MSDDSEELEPPRGPGPGMARPLLIGAVVLVVAATVALVFSDSVRWLRLGVIAALWAALAGAFLAAKFRRDASARGDEIDALHNVYELELEREVAARREHELQVQADAARMAAGGGGADPEQIAELRAELRTLREHLETLLGGELLVERVALHAESTRMMRAITDSPDSPLRSDRSENAVSSIGPVQQQVTARRPANERPAIGAASAEADYQVEQPTEISTGAEFADDRPAERPVERPAERPVAPTVRREPTRQPAREPVRDPAPRYQPANKARPPESAGAAASALRPSVPARVSHNAEGYPAATVANVLNGNGAANGLANGAANGANGANGLANGANGANGLANGANGANGLANGANGTANGAASGNGARSTHAANGNGGRAASSHGPPDGPAPHGGQNGNGRVPAIAPDWTPSWESGARAPKPDDTAAWIPEFADPDFAPASRPDRGTGRAAVPYDAPPRDPQTRDPQPREFPYADSPSRDLPSRQAASQQSSRDYPFGEAPGRDAQSRQAAAPQAARDFPYGDSPSREFRQGQQAPRDFPFDDAPSREAQSRQAASPQGARDFAFGDAQGRGTQGRELPARDAQSREPQSREPQSRGAQPSGGPYRGGQDRGGQDRSGQGRGRDPQSYGAAPGDFPARDQQSREFAPHESQPRDFQPREPQPRDFQPRDPQPRDFQPRDPQPRDFQPRDPQSYEFPERGAQPGDQGRSDEATRYQPAVEPPSSACPAARGDAGSSRHAEPTGGGGRRRRPDNVSFADSFGTSEPEPSGRHGGGRGAVPTRDTRDDPPSGGHARPEPADDRPGRRGGYSATPATQYFDARAAAADDLDPGGRAPYAEPAEPRLGSHARPDAQAREPEQPPPGEPGAHAAGRAVSDLLAAYGHEDSPRRRRRRAD